MKQACYRSRHDIKETIKHVIDVFGSENLRDKQFFIDAIEDYNPELEEDSLEKIYFDYVGNLRAYTGYGICHNNKSIYKKNVVNGTHQGRGVLKIYHGG